MESWEVVMVNGKGSKRARKWEMMTSGWCLIIGQEENGKEFWGNLGVKLAVSVKRCIWGLVCWGLKMACNVFLGFFILSYWSVSMSPCEQHAFLSFYSFITCLRVVEQVLPLCSSRRVSQPVLAMYVS